ncbi:choice-of-anchor F family protein [Thiomicrorhabdus sp.]|uniref:choice-of-anchor F family protein n=1 Tax=Thiomicrorhabdus sp. TaxID=2039724 RepID=UPI003569DE43
MQKTKLFKLSVIASACLAAASTAQADIIKGIQNSDISTQGASVTGFTFDQYNPIQFGFGGMNLDNQTVKIVDAETGAELAKSYDATSGTYSAMVDGDTFYNEVNDGVGTPTAKLASKVWPVGEPAGVKVLTDTDLADVYMNNGKPYSCIMSTAYHRFSDDPDYVDGIKTLPAGATMSDGFLDSAYPNPTMCDSAFQTHKRFKVSALPASLNSSIDLVFNVDNTANSQIYMVLQKLNNYTGKHLSGFKVQVGTGVGAGFTQSASATAVALSDGVGEKDGGGDIWDAPDMAAFSSGLFGPGDSHHEPGFFDNTARAGFYAAETTDVKKNEIASTGVMGTTYHTLFGSDWLPSIYQPQGIFYDFDNNPDTDDQLVAWWGDDPNTAAADYQWLKGAADNYAPVSMDVLATWAANSQYYVGGIEDTVNLGLSYIVDLGDLTLTPDATTFTLRLIPIEATEQTVPGYMETVNEAPTTLDQYVASSSSGFSAYDNTSLLATILGFLGLGALVARRKLSK